MFTIKGCFSGVAKKELKGEIKILSINETGEEGVESRTPGDCDY